MKLSVLMPVFNQSQTILRYKLWDVEPRTAGVLSMAAGKNDLMNRDQVCSPKGQTDIHAHPK